MPTRNEESGITHFKDLLRTEPSEAISLLREHGLRIKLARREQANAITLYSLRNTILEDYHPKVTQQEMKLTMIEASARIDFLLKERRFFKMPAEETFEFAFRRAITNNCKPRFTSTEWAALQVESIDKIHVLHSIHSKSRVEFGLFLIGQWYFGCQSWDYHSRFDGNKVLP